MELMREGFLLILVQFMDHLVGHLSCRTIDALSVRRGSSKARASTSTLAVVACPVATALHAFKQVPKSYGSIQIILNLELTFT